MLSIKSANTPQVTHITGTKRLELDEFLEVNRSDQVERPVLAADRQFQAVGTERDGLGGIARLERANRRANRHVPNLECVVGAAGRDHRAVLAERDAEDLLGMPGGAAVGSDFLAGRGFPE